MEENKSFKVSLGIVVCMFVILILIMALAVVYYLGVVKNNQKILDLTDEINSLKSKNNIIQADKDNDCKNTIQTEKDNDKNNDNELNEIKSNDISVVDALDYSDGYYQLFKVKLPKIVGNTETIEKLNFKMLNEILPLTYCDVVTYSDTRDTEEVSMDKGSIYNYRYAIENDILIIYIYSSVPEGGSVMPASWSGLNSKGYYYDISNDEILTIGEAASKLELDLDGLETIDHNSITSYDELEEAGYYISIYNNKLELSAVFL